MKKVITYLIIAIFFLSSCSNLSDSPKNTYYEFEEFCADGNQSSAKLLVSQQGFDENQKLGVCNLSPNNYYKLLETGKFTLDDHDPKVEIHRGIALLKWWIADSKKVMIMDEIDGVWKIHTTILEP
jgi:hypothetical protein